jgi:hypothetical protein
MKITAENLKKDVSISLLTDIIETETHQPTKLEYIQLVLLRDVDISGSRIDPEKGVRSVRKYINLRLRYILSGEECRDLKVAVVTDIKEGSYVFEYRRCACMYGVTYFNGYLYCNDNFVMTCEGSHMFHKVFDEEKYGTDYRGRIFPVDEIEYLSTDDMHVCIADDETVYCESQCENIFADNSRHGIYDHDGNRGYWHNEYEDSVSTDDRTYISASVAESRGCWFDENDGEWREESEQPRNGNRTFDNPYSTYEIDCLKRSLSQLKYDKLVNKLGVKSSTYGRLGGLRYTFGVEIETSEAGDSSRDFKSLELNWGSVYDGSVSGPEYVSGVLRGDTGLVQVEDMCSYLNERNFELNSDCGVHVHIGVNNFNRRSQMLAIMLGMQVESELFAMVPASRSESSYCRKIPGRFLGLGNSFEFGGVKSTSYAKTLNLLARYVTSSCSSFSKDSNKKSRHPDGHYCSSRYKWLNLNNLAFADGPNTIEFRQHGGTMNAEKIIPWVKICMAFVKFTEDRGRRIIKGFQDFKSFEDGKSLSSGSQVTLNEIIKYSYPEKMADELIKYSATRSEEILQSLS